MEQAENESYNTRLHSKILSNTKIDTIRFDALINTFHKHAIIMLDCKGNIISWNNGATLITGYTENEVLGHNISFIYGGFHHLYSNSKKELDIFLLKEKYTHHQWCTHKNGTRYWGRLEITPYFESDQILKGFNVILKDKTRQKINGKEKLNMDKRLQLFIDVVKDYAIFMVDPQGYILTWNEGAKRIKGYTADEVIDQHFSMFYEEKDKKNKKSDRALKIALHQGKYEEEGWRVRKNGSKFWANVIITPFYDENAELIGFGKVTRDLTDKRKTEKKLRTSLEKNTNLLQINQSLEEYAYIVAHDLKEPLRGVHHFAHLMEIECTESLSPEGKRMIASIKSLTEKAAKLLESLLQVSRVGRTKLSLHKTDLNHLIAELLEFLNDFLKSHQAKVIITKPLPIIYCDSVRIRELFHNLIINAIKYNDKPLKEIEIGYLRQSEDSSKESMSNSRLQHIFYVRDNGIGIAKKFHHTIFKSFHRLHSRGQFDGGAGLGLSIVQKVIERHEGKIWIESTVNKGTTFYFSFGNKFKIQEL